LNNGGAVGEVPEKTSGAESMFTGNGCAFGHRAVGKGKHIRLKLSNPPFMPLVS
jgi:hypothetical protein